MRLKACVLAKNLGGGKGVVQKEAKEPAAYILATMLQISVDSSYGSPRNIVWFYANLECNLGHVTLFVQCDVSR